MLTPEPTPPLATQELDLLSSPPVELEGMISFIVTADEARVINRHLGEGGKAVEVVYSRLGAAIARDVGLDGVRINHVTLANSSQDEPLTLRVDYTVTVPGGAAMPALPFGIRPLPEEIVLEEELGTVAASEGSEAAAGWTRQLDRP